MELRKAPKYYSKISRSVKSNQEDNDCENATEHRNLSTLAFNIKCKLENQDKETQRDRGEGEGAARMRVYVGLKVCKNHKQDKNLSYHNTLC